MAKREPLEWQWAIDAMETTVLSTRQFRMQWLNWASYRRNVLKKPVTKFGVTRTIRKLEKWGHERAIAAIRHSMDCEWRGIYEAGGPVTKRDATRIQAAPGKYDDVRIFRK